MSKDFDLDSNVKVGVTDIVNRPRGPRSRKEKLLEREATALPSQIETGREIRAPLATTHQPSKNPNQDSLRPAYHEQTVSTHERAPELPRAPMDTSVSAHCERSVSRPAVPVIADGIITQALEKKISIQIRHLSVLNFLKTNLVTENVTRLVWHKQICDVTGIPFGSVRRYLAELQSLGVILSAKKGSANGFQGNYYELNLVKTREFLGMMESLRYMSADFNEPRLTPKVREHAVSAHRERSLSTNSSNSYLNVNSTTTEAVHYDLSSLDLSEFPGMDLETMVQFRNHFQTLDGLQDFIDKVAYVVQKSRGTSSELKNPVGFLFKSLERRYINVDAGYKSRAIRREEEELKAKQREIEDLKRIRDAKKAVELERTRFRFDEWLETVAQERIDEFEKERLRVYPPTAGFDSPASIRMKQMRQIQVDTFILENGLPMTFREKLIGGD